MQVQRVQSRQFPEGLTGNNNDSDECNMYQTKQKSKFSNLNNKIFDDHKDLDKYKEGGFESENLNNQYSQPIQERDHLEPIEQDEQNQEHSGSQDDDKFEQSAVVSDEDPMLDQKLDNLH